MKKFMVLFALLVVAAGALATDKDHDNHDNKDRDKDKGKKSAVDSGSFGIYLNGKRIGTEKFSIEQQAGDGVDTAEITVDDGTSKAEQRSELRVGSDGSLKLYKWNSTLPSKEESVVEPKDQLLVEHLTTAEQKKREVPYVLPLSTVILDDNVFSHRELLLWRYLQTGCIVQDGDRRCGPSHFGILVPHQHAAGTTVVQLMGRNKITFKGVEKELNQFKVETDGVQWLIWMDDPENNYRVLKMAIPASNVEVWRD